MIKKLLGVLIVLFLATLPAMAQGTVRSETAVESDSYITYVEGDVFFRNFEKVIVGMDILQGDELITRRGYVEVYLAGNLLRLDWNTRVGFLSLEEIVIWSGQVYVQVNIGEIRIRTNYQEFLLKSGFYRVRANEARYFNDPYYYYDWSWRWHRHFYGFRYHPWYPSWVYPRYSPRHYYSPRMREKTIIRKKQLQAPSHTSPRVLRPRDSTSRPVISRRPNQQQPNRATPPPKKKIRKD